MSTQLMEHLHDTLLQMHRVRLSEKPYGVGGGQPGWAVQLPADLKPVKGLEGVSRGCSWGPTALGQGIFGQPP